MYFGTVSGFLFILSGIGYLVDRLISLTGRAILHGGSQVSIRYNYEYGTSMDVMLLFQRYMHEQYHLTWQWLTGAYNNVAIGFAFLFLFLAMFFFILTLRSLRNPREALFRERQKLFLQDEEYALYLRQRRSGA